MTVVANKCSPENTAPDSQLGHTRRMRRELRKVTPHQTQTSDASGPYHTRCTGRSGCTVPTSSASQKVDFHQNDLQLLPLLPCANTKVSQHLCKCVSIFTNIFPRELASQVATPLDPNTYAKLDRSNGTR